MPSKPKNKQGQGRKRGAPTGVPGVSEAAAFREKPDRPTASRVRRVAESAGLLKLLAATLCCSFIRIGLRMCHRRPEPKGKGARC